MPLITYNRDIPDQPNNPSVDQPDMKINTNSVDDIINVDHYSFNDNLGGLHKQVRMPALAARPAGLVVGEGTFYTKTVQVAPGPINATQAFYAPDAGAGLEYQITRTIDGVSGFFGVFVNDYNGVGVAYSGGWTFLPGGLLYQYGVYNAATLSSSGTIFFPVQFINTPFVVQPVLIAKVGGTTSLHTVSVISGSLGATSFQWNLDSSTAGSYTGIYWTAIGK